MDLALNLGYWGPGNGSDTVELAVVADQLGYRCVWAAEAYGSDAVTVLSFIAARTTQIDVGSAILQIPARSPAMTAMTAATLDQLSGGRVRLGLGVSGPQVSEGWHGVRFAQPLGRTREYVQIVNQVLARETLRFEGKHFTLPLPGGPGKALKLAMRPVRSHIPIYLAAVGPKNLELVGEIADGWHGIFIDPERSEDFLTPLRTGARKAGKGTETDPLAGFDICPSVMVSVADDLEQAAAPLRAQWALYIGGMGSREQNFYNRATVAMGYGAAADQIQELYLEGRHREAAAAVPLELIDRTALLGSPARIADRMQRYRDAGTVTLSVTPVGRSIPERAAVLRSLTAAV